MGVDVARDALQSHVQQEQKEILQLELTIEDQHSSPIQLYFQPHTDVLVKMADGNPLGSDYVLFVEAFGGIVEWEEMPRRQFISS